MADEKESQTRDQMFTVSQAAEEIGVTSSALLKAIWRGRVPATRLGSQWIIRYDDLMAYKNTRHHGGHPKSTT